MTKVLCYCSRLCECPGFRNSIGFIQEYCCNCFIDEFRPNHWKITDITKEIFTRCDMCFEALSIRLERRLFA